MWLRFGIFYFLREFDFIFTVFECVLVLFNVFNCVLVKFLCPAACSRVARLCAAARFRVARFWNSDYVALGAKTKSLKNP